MLRTLRGDYLILYVSLIIMTQCYSLHKSESAVSLATELSLL